MKKLTLILAFLTFPAAAFHIAAQSTHRVDTTFQYNDRNVVVHEKNDEINVSIYRLNEEGDTIKSKKIYEGIFTDNKEIERRFESSFEISVPDIFKPKEKRKDYNSHWAGFGIGFASIHSGAELSSILNASRSLRYKLNFAEGVWHWGNTNLTGMAGMGIEFNSIHFQNNKFMEVSEYKSVISTAETGKELNTSRLHYTYLTFPFLTEKTIPIGKCSYLFFNGGIVAKVKTASSSKVWFNEDGKEKKTRMPFS